VASAESVILPSSPTIWVARVFLLTLSLYLRQVLCLSPTYELAVQTGEVIVKMSQFMPEISLRYAVRGEEARMGSVITDHIIIGTPGKVRQTKKSPLATSFPPFSAVLADLLVAFEKSQSPLPCFLPSSSGRWLVLAGCSQAGSQGRTSANLFPLGRRARRNLEGGALSAICDGLDRPPPPPPLPEVVRARAKPSLNVEDGRKALLSSRLAGSKKET